MNIGNYLVILAMLVPLSLDTFVLSAALGLAGLPKKDRLRTSIILTLFEALMPIVGVLIGAGIGSFIGHFAGYVAGAVIGLAGLIMLYPSKDEDNDKRKVALLARTRGLAIIDLGISISIDELAIGLSLGLLHVPMIAVVIYLAIQAFVAAQLGLWLGGKLSNSLQEGAEKLAGILLLLIGTGMIVLKVSGHQL